MSDWLARQESKRVAKRNRNRAQPDLLEYLKPIRPRFEPPRCACGADGVYGFEVALRKEQLGEWFCAPCARKAGWYELI